MADNIISVRHLCFSYTEEDAAKEHPVLKNLNIDIERGSFVSILGHNGSGKSTFLRCLNCLEDPTSGSIYFDGVDIADVRVDINIHRQNMGMVFQQFNLFNNKTVLENIMLAIDSSNPLRITVLNQVPKALELLRQDPQVSRLSVDENKIAAWFSGSREEEAYLLQKLVDAGILVVSFAREHNSLESLFFHLTGETEQKSRNTETFGNTIG